MDLYLWIWNNVVYFYFLKNFEKYFYKIQYLYQILFWEVIVLRLLEYSKIHLW